MFTEMPADQTGVVTENKYADPKMWWELYHEFEVGEIGTGVAIGDCDGDGKPDIFVVSKTESCHLFRNLGNFKFEDVSEKAGVADHGDAAGIWKQGATFVDVNNDGLLDLYVCRFNAPNLLYINQGDGTFKEMAHQYGLDVKDASVMAAFCDYDRDGWLDVFIQTNLLDAAGHQSGQRNYLFHNNRNGTFTNVTDKAGILAEAAQGHAAIWWDFDGDGWPDLYVANDFVVKDRLYHNNRDGTFTNVIDQVVPRMPFSAMGADIGDINNDGLIDFLVADMAASTHEKDQRGMVNSRAQAFEPANDSTEAEQNYRNALYINTGTGHFLEASFLAGVGTTDWTWAVRFEDLDNDGRLDLFVTNGMHRESTNADLLAAQMVAESPRERIGIMRNSPVMAEEHLAFRNMGDLVFKNMSAEWGLNKKSVAFGAAFGDLDGDGDLDLVYTNYQDGVTVMRNDSPSGHRVIFDLRGTVSNRFGVGATVKVESALGLQVRTLVLERGLLSSSEPILHFGLGDDAVMKTVTVTWPSGRVQVFHDLAVDRRYTITEPSTADAPLAAPPAKIVTQFSDVSDTLGLKFLSKEEPVDETSQQRLLPVRLNRRGPALAVGDLDGDGEDEIILGGTSVGAARMIQKTPKGSYVSGDLSAIAPVNTLDDGPVLIFDANGDGKNDVLITKGGNALPSGAPEYQPKLFLNDGHSGLQLAAADSLPTLSLSVGAAVAGDFNHDGLLDVFLGARVENGQYPLSPHSVLLANRGGKFEDVTDAVAPGLREVGMVTSALWTDVDGDGWLDLLVTLEWGPVKYFHNAQGKRLEDWTEKAGFASAGTGWWNSIAAADFNGDGRLDYVVGNVGLNTQYRADPKHPALLFFGDFAGSGEEPQIVEAYYEGDRLYPWRSRKDLGAAIPSVLKKFPKNNAYARATLEEIFGAAKLGEAQRFAATELRSGVFLSQPDGTYRFEPLPHIAQIAPIFGLVTGDFDGDGHADIYAVQNSFAPVPAVGREDGGLSQLLCGDGHGHFAPMPPRMSGLVVSGDAKAVATLDVNDDGWADFLVTRNNGATIAYENQPIAGRHPLEVRLAGLPGNLTAVGARVVAVYADGSTQTGEVAAGSGFYSESAASCFFGYTDENPLRALRITWPTGVKSEIPVPAGHAIILISQPK